MPKSRMQHGASLLVAGILSIAPDPAWPAWQERPEVDWIDCQAEGFPESVECGTLPVAENPGVAGSRQIDLFVVRVPATEPEPENDPVFFLSGGPGQAASPMAGMFARMWAEVGRRRDLVLVDQRGTGRSNALECPVAGDPELAQTYLAGPFDPSRYRGCVDELSARADLRAYTTRHIVEDLEQVREALGYERINIFGASYGSWLGLEYMRLHPDAIRSAILVAVAPDFPRMVLTTAERLDQAVATIARECAEESACAEAYPDFGDDLRDIVEQLRAAPMTVSLPARGRRPEQVLTIDSGAFLTALRYSLYSTPVSRQLPQIVDQIANGDTEPLARFVSGRTRGAGAGVALGMNRSVRCAEVVAHNDPDRVREAAASTLQGGLRAHYEFEICSFWPAGAVDTAFGKPFESDIPALLVTGEHDFTTPAADGERAVENLPNGRFVMLSGARHQLAGYDGCLREIYSDFLDRGSATGLDLTCTQVVPEWPFRIEEEAVREARRIRRAALDYIEGWYAGDADRMSAALHPRLVKRMAVPNRDGASELNEQTAEMLVRMTGARGQTGALAGGRADIEILDVFEDAAVVRVDADDWVDFLQLVRWDGEWRILNVLWELRPEARR